MPSSDEKMDCKDRMLVERKGFQLEELGSEWCILWLSNPAFQPFVWNKEQ